MTARIAEESRTAGLAKPLLHLAPCLFAALCNQFIGSQRRGVGEGLEFGLNPTDFRDLRLDAEYSVLERHDNDVPGVQSHVLSYRGWNHDAAVVIYSRCDMFSICDISWS